MSEHVKPDAAAIEAFRSKFEQTRGMWLDPHYVRRELLEPTYAADAGLAALVKGLDEWKQAAANLNERWAKYETENAALVAENRRLWALAARHDLFGYEKQETVIRASTDERDALAAQVAMLRETGYAAPRCYQRLHRLRSTNDCGAVLEGVGSSLGPLAGRPRRDGAEVRLPLDRCAGDIMAVWLLPRLGDAPPEPREAAIDAAEAWYFGDQHPPERAVMRPFIRGMAREIIRVQWAASRARAPTPIQERP